MPFVGVNIGALTVKVVRADATIAKVMAHQGRSWEVLADLLATPEFTDAEYFGVSGHLGHISEFAAIQRALRELEGQFDAVVSLGGESFLVYMLVDGRITNVLSHNRCAAGSGEFFVQLIGGMGLDMDEAIQLSSTGKVVPLASRCSAELVSQLLHSGLRDAAVGRSLWMQLNVQGSRGNRVLGTDNGCVTQIDNTIVRQQTHIRSRDCRGTHFDWCRVS
jgi:hypothetical protein